MSGNERAMRVLFSHRHQHQRASPDNLNLTEAERSERTGEQRHQSSSLGLSKQKQIRRLTNDDLSPLLAACRFNTGPGRDLSSHFFGVASWECEVRQARRGQAERSTWQAGGVDLELP